MLVLIEVHLKKICGCLTKFDKPQRTFLDNNLCISSSFFLMTLTDNSGPQGNKPQLVNGLMKDLCDFLTSSSRYTVS